MFPAGLRKAVYAFVAVEGLFTAVAPRLSARLSTRLSLPGFENTGDLEPTDWYVRAVRATGVGMLAAGGTALLLESRAETAAAAESAADDEEYDFEFDADDAAEFETDDDEEAADADDD